MIHVKGTRIRCHTFIGSVGKRFSLGLGAIAKITHWTKVMAEITKWALAINPGKEETEKLEVGNGSIMSITESHFHLEGGYAFINETARPTHAPCAWLIRGPLALVKHERTSGTSMVRGAGG